MMELDKKESVKKSAPKPFSRAASIVLAKRTLKTLPERKPKPKRKFKKTAPTQAAQTKTTQGLVVYLGTTKTAKVLGVADVIKAVHARITPRHNAAPRARALFTQESAHALLTKRATPRST